MGKEGLIRIKSPGGTGDVLIDAKQAKRLAAEGRDLTPTQSTVTPAMAKTLRKEAKAREKEAIAKKKEEDAAKAEAKSTEPIIEEKKDEGKVEGIMKKVADAVEGRKEKK